VTHARRGEKAELVRMAETNARELLDERRRTKVGYDAALGELRERLGLPRLPRRIECFDISNVQGAHPTGSMVSLADGFPDKAGYRKFAVKSVEGSDDFAMLYEVLSRRLGRRGEEGWHLPDLLVVDGGRGQLAMAVKALEDAGVPDLPVAGLAKARVLDGDGAQVEHSPERVFLPGRLNPVILPKNSSALFVLQRARDEAHRFAVAYHRRRRTKANLASAVDAVPGVGSSRRRALLKHFGSLRRLREAGWEEIARVPGIPETVARRIAEALAATSPGGDGPGSEGPKT
jgi:excinuclease ABC subunit C